MDPEAQDNPAAMPALSGLPAEVRNMIYRLLLTTPTTLGNAQEREPGELGPQDGPVWARSGQYHLQPAILRVCKQFHEEGTSILYGENTVGVNVHRFPFESVTQLMNFEFDTKLASFAKGTNAPLEEFKKFEILIQIPSRLYPNELPRLKFAITRFCSFYLNKITIHHLSLHLLYNNTFSRHTVLEAFTMLRNVRSVAFHGVPIPYAESLSKLILGNTPQGELQQMYHALEKYVKGFDGFEAELMSAETAVEELNVAKFTLIRSEIVSAVKRRMDEALLQLYAHDIKSAGKRSEMFRKE